MSSTPQYYVSRKTLILTCTITWFFAGISVFITGVQTWLITDMKLIYKLFFALLTFCIFNFIIFKPFSKKNIQRILGLNHRNHPLTFFDARGWAIMLFMMSLGFSVRKFSLLPNTFIAPFYVGLSIALTLVGLKFAREWMKSSHQ